MIPLVSAERAWSLAMELKAELEKDPNGHKRQHMVSDFHNVQVLLAGYPACTMRGLLTAAPQQRA